MEIDEGVKRKLEEAAKNYSAKKEELEEAENRTDALARECGLARLDFESALWEAYHLATETPAAREARLEAERRNVLT